MSKQRYRVISVLGIAAALALIILGTLSFLRPGIDLFAGASKNASAAGLSGNDLKVSPASILEIDGLWEVMVTNGPPAIHVQADAKQLEGIRFAQDGERISLRQDGALGGIGLIHPVRLEISMPALRQIRLGGAGNMTVSGIKADELELSLQGGCKLVLKDAAVQNLKLNAEGACNADMAEATVTNALVNLQGAANATITMAGGRLDGQIQGVGHVSYYGSVSSETIRTEGLAKVEKK